MNTKMAVVGIIQHQGKILLGKKVKKNEHEMSDTWHIPGGKVEQGENEVDALKREMLEETHLEISIVKLIKETVSDSGTVVKWYLCRPMSYDLKPGDDLVDARFVPKEDVFKICGTRAVELWPQEVRDYLLD